jgi:zinc transport system ATP-binding protein
VPRVPGHSMSLISASHITVRLGGHEALTDVSLAVEPAEIVTILGPNGSGKSTLLRALLGILPLSHGAVARQPGLVIGYVPQRLSIDRTLPMTVRRFLSLPVRCADGDAAAALIRVGLADVAQRQMADLSGGQFQRVLLARALLARPHLLILDEPTQGLDQPGEAAFYRLIEEVRRETGVAVLMVSHDLHVVMAASDRVICLNRHVCCEGTPRVVSTAPEYRALFGLGTQGALALYQHIHDHSHEGHDHSHEGHDHGAGHIHAADTHGTPSHKAHDHA